MWEWVFDYYAFPYPASCDNCVTTSGSDRVIRGGGFSLGAALLTASFRVIYTPATRDYPLGVRCVRTVQ
jgi:formylglycine-generating enzyme required for sulfatase activity